MLQLFSYQFGALNTLLLVVVLGLCILAAYLIKQNSFYYLPESAAAIIVGLIVGALARYFRNIIHVTVSMQVKVF
jgi:sodium/hydrogen exchanger 8